MNIGTGAIFTKGLSQVLGLTFAFCIDTGYIANVSLAKTFGQYGYWINRFKWE